ncbi:SAG-related sequence protein SRS48Q [Toxoplasma gondii GT1]|uniref:SAG-related sequence protein SRS48Q n=2 Tax=Toxoplasma gondii TaxID=5811 RepID=S7UG93_TOXGG|nr:SAG-related sequence protein SRS48Q [Toxoplasma gondii GT1]KAF4639936.1 SAG-related sequence SRS48Q [Toxoplasma gondii]
MAGRVSGAVCGVKALRSAVRAAVVIGLFCLSTGMAEDDKKDDVFTCSTVKKQSVVSLKLKDKETPIKFACPEDYDVFPAITGEPYEFCRDSLCEQKAPLAPAFSIQESEAETQTDEERNYNLLEENQGLSTVYKLTMKEQVAASSTLYFQCRKTKSDEKSNADDSTVADEEDESKPGKLHNDLIHCAFQVAAYGSKAAAETLQKEHECKLNTELSATLNTSSTSFTFRCPKDSRLLPVNFDKAYEGRECTKKRFLNRLGLNASLLEGKSVTSQVETVAAEASEETSPAYTFSVSEFPEKDVHVCYYCVDSKAKKEQINTRDKVCKALIEVKGVPKPDHAASSGTATFSTNKLVMAGAILISSALVMSISA